MLRVIMYFILATSLVADEPVREIVKRGDEVHVPSPDCWSHVEYDFYAFDKDGKKFELPGILRGDQVYWKVGSSASQAEELLDGEYSVYLRVRGSKCLPFGWKVEVVTPQYQNWDT